MPGLSALTTCWLTHQWCWLPAVLYFSTVYMRTWLNVKKCFRILIRSRYSIGKDEAGILAQWQADWEWATGNIRNKIHAHVKKRSCRHLESYRLYP